MIAPVSLAAIKNEHLVQSVTGDEAVCVSGVKLDSRFIEKGDLFVAAPGAHSDGVEFIPEAIARGAAAVLVDRPVHVSVPVLFDPHLFPALARVASRIYGDPSAELEVVGITGTNGKTTITYLIESMLNAAGAKPAVIGTVGFRGPGGSYPASHTTPMADALMRLTRQFVDAGATHLIMEVSSHALATHRADGMHYRVAAYTNLTQDHLDFHGDLARYAAAKRRLFIDLIPRVSVINIDDAFGRELASGLKMPVLRCSKHASVQADFRALRWSSDRSGISAELATPAGTCELKSPLIGSYNLDNLLTALGCGSALGVPLDQMLGALTSAVGAPGRLERLADPRNVLVAVDYAHTPDALENVLATLRPLTQGRLWVVFGCGGDRDAGKRPIMGKIAGERGSLAILTSDNPRSEQPERILQQIEAGTREAGIEKIAPGELASATRGYVVEPDRRRAIRLALAHARSGDTVLIAGKGHETVQIVGAERHPFDDRIEARKAVAAALEGGH
jgi:UDP-N-acetylmuramoyl-L-alanyl-D-glutamate--2,6-diaminopimelate ligase